MSYLHDENCEDDAEYHNQNLISLKEIVKVTVFRTLFCEENLRDEKGSHDNNSTNNPKGCDNVS